ncbi:MAG: efflux RND transporter periplasmic adaptor subunit [Gammaproteobacteria bacterium]|nr:efflux RND transporter periplasmic adaptor subunit [Gammaproteobacteria bacterium]
MKMPLILLVLGVGLLLGVLLQRTLLTDEAVTGRDVPESAEEVLYWVAPMDPNYRRDEPGKSPMGMDLVPVYGTPTDSSDSVDGPGLVRISPAVINNLGVRTGRAEVGSLAREIESVGYIRHDEQRLHQINTRVAGWIDRLGVRSQGEPVTQGQVLFELYAPELVNAQREYLAALRMSSQSLIDASTERLLALGAGPDEVVRLKRSGKVLQRLPVAAPSDGYVVELAVQEGAHVTVHSPVMSIAALDSVWVIVEVLERQAAWLEVGQPAEVVLDAFPGRRWQGTVDYIYPELDDKSRTLKARLQLANPDLILRPNMFGRVRIRGRATEAVIHIPREALIRGSLDRVVLALGDGRFRSVPVVAGIESGGRVAVLSGLEADARVVISGQFLIDSESNLGTALRRMESLSTEPQAEEKPVVEAGAFSGATP